MKIPFNKQYGLSLISLMIGLFISVLCILASLTLYKNLVHVAAESKVDTLFDGQLSTAIMVAQMEIQSAGYGLDAAGANDIVIHNTPAAGTTPAKTELLWRYLEGGAYSCQRLIEQTVTDADGTAHRSLVLQKATAGCNGTVNLTTITAANWGTGTTLAMWLQTPELNTYMSAKSTILRFELNPRDCSPFGRLDAARHLQLTITAPSSNTLHTSNTSVLNVFEFCLPNTYPAV